MEIPQKFPFIQLDEFVIMPNHVHGILFINKINDNKNNYSLHNKNLMNFENVMRKEDAINRAPTVGGVTNNKNPMLYQNLSTIIRWYKGRVTFETKKINDFFDKSIWQTRFYEHVIRNNDELNRIRNYIRCNLLNLENDNKNST
ncbi:MAG: transposase [Candidatus Margulisiibacteriota bacterium]